MTSTTLHPVEFYRENGYLHVPDVVTGTELAHLQAASAKMIEFASAHRVTNEDYKYRQVAGSSDETFYRINNPKARSVEFQALFGHPRLLQIFHDLIGPNFVVLNDALVVKLPRSVTDFPWHRDVAGDATKAGSSLLVPGLDLDISNVENGCVHVVPGSHLDADSNISALTQQYGFDLPGAVSLTSSPGAVSVHSGNTLHGSLPNTSGNIRRTVYVAAMDIDDYLASYQATPDLVKIHIALMFQTIEARQSLPWLADEEPFEWSGSPEWRVDAHPGDFLEWNIPAAPPRVAQ